MCVNISTLHFQATAVDTALVGHLPRLYVKSPGTDTIAVAVRPDGTEGSAEER